ncbi:MAG: protein kinase, partial [Planctomycetota bacterium]
MALTLDTRRKAFMLEARVRGATAVEAAEAFTSLGGSRENNGGGLLAPITEVGQEDGPRSMGDLARELQDSSSNSSAVSKRRAPGAFAPRSVDDEQQQQELVKKEGASKRKSTAPQRHGSSSSASKGKQAKTSVASDEMLEKERALRIEAERVAQSLRADLERERSAAARERGEIAAKHGLLRSALESTLRESAEAEAREKRRELGHAAFELGRARSHSAIFGGDATNWEAGDAERDLRRRRNELLAKKDALERKKAEIEKSSGIERVSDRAAVEAQEASLAREQRDVAAEASALERRKMTHIREWTRAKSEDMSQWKGRPLQNDRYLLLSLLGKGGFSEVWLAYDLDTATKVAVKFHSLDRNWRDERKREYVKRVAREYSIMRDLDHPRVVKLYDVFEIDDDTFATVLEYCSGEDLDAVLRSRKLLPEPDARAIILQVLAGLHHLHSPNGAGPDRRAAIIHYDLKPGNILFDHNGDVKITDF